jgi:hypothetical protein
MDYSVSLVPVKSVNRDAVKSSESEVTEGSNVIKETKKRSFKISLVTDYVDNNVISSEPSLAVIRLETTSEKKNLKLNLNVTFDYSIILTTISDITKYNNVGFYLKTMESFNQKELSVYRNTVPLLDKYGIKMLTIDCNIVSHGKKKRKLEEEDSDSTILGADEDVTEMVENSASAPITEKTCNRDKYCMDRVFPISALAQISNYLCDLNTNEVINKKLEKDKCSERGVSIYNYIEDQLSKGNEFTLCDMSLNRREKDFAYSMNISLAVTSQHTNYESHVELVTKQEETATPLREVVEISKSMDNLKQGILKMEERLRKLQDKFIE